MGTKLRSPVAVHDRGAGTSKCDGVMQGADSELGGHTGVGGVPHDPVGEDVLHDAAVSFPSLVRCSVMSVSHSSFGASAVKSRSTRSSWTGGPGRR